VRLDNVQWVASPWIGTNVNADGRVKPSGVMKETSRYKHMLNVTVNGA
jgi:hypothetical protein